MEKQGVIKPGLTPPEEAEKQGEQKPVTKSSAEQIAELDNDFRLRAAETIYKTGK